MNTRLVGTSILTAFLLCGCSDGSTTIGPSPIASVQPMASHGYVHTGRVSLRGVDDAIVEPVCNFSAPQAFSANENSGKVDVQFDLVLGVLDYELEIDRWTGTAWDMYERSVVQQPLTWYGAQQPDRFKLRLRSLTCSNQGTWSEPAFVTVDRAAPAAPSAIEFPQCCLVFIPPWAPLFIPGPPVNPPSCFACHKVQP